MCFAPQRRALFRHRNFQKWSDNGVFCTFWLRNVLRATTACNFSSLIWPAGSAPAALASLLFDPPEPQIIGKTQCFATFLPFRASPSSFFLLFLFYSSFFYSFSSLCLFPALLFICPYCRKFASLSSKLPSNILLWKDPPFLMGKSTTISMAIFNSYVTNYQSGRKIKHTSCMFVGWKKRSKTY